MRGVGRSRYDVITGHPFIFAASPRGCRDEGISPGTVFPLTTATFPPCHPTSHLHTPASHRETSNNKTSRISSSTLKSRRTIVHPPLLVSVSDHLRSPVLFPPRLAHYNEDTELSDDEEPSSRHLQVPNVPGMDEASRRSMEDEERPLPEGWVRQFDVNQVRWVVFGTGKGEEKVGGWVVGGCCGERKRRPSILITRALD
jgi:hypothetical protein